MNRPWMPLYIADYLRDTAHLRAVESGAYLHLIMAYWISGALPNNDRQLATIAKLTDAEWKELRPCMEAFFGEGFTSHKRIDKELAKVTDISNKRRAAVHQRGNKATIKRPSIDDTLHTTQSKKEDTASAVSKYEFESGVIRLSASDLSKWKSGFSNLDVPAELLGLTQWAGTQANWFHAVAGALAKRNRDVAARKVAAHSPPARPLSPFGTPYPDGII